MPFLIIYLRLMPLEQHPLLGVRYVANAHELGTPDLILLPGTKNTVDEAVTLIEATGTYSDTITLPDGGNYIGIECESFTGSIELNIE